MDIPCTSGGNMRCSVLRRRTGVPTNGKSNALYPDIATRRTISRVPNLPATFARGRFSTHKLRYGNRIGMSGGEMTFAGREVRHSRGLKSSKDGGVVRNSRQGGSLLNGVPRDVRLSSFASNSGPMDGQKSDLSVGNGDCSEQNSNSVHVASNSESVAEMERAVTVRANAASPSPSNDNENDTNGAGRNGVSVNNSKINTETMSRVVGPQSPPGPSAMESVQTTETLPEQYIESNGWLPHRWKITFMMGLAFILCNMDKVNMSVAVIPMAQDLGWSATSRGLVQSAFFWGYTLTQIPAGWISTRIGGANVLLAGVALWSLGTLIAPGAAHMGFTLLCISRCLVGLGEGFAPSAATSVLAKQVPESERARAVATVFGGLDLGSAVGLLLCGPLIRMYGWPCVFYWFAIVGLVWCVAWPLTNPHKQDAIMWTRKQEAMKEAGSQAKNDDTDNVPWGEFFKSLPVWAIIVAHFSYNWGYYTLLSWLPSFFELALNLNVQSSSFLTVIPYIAMTAMTPLVGPAADNMVKGGMSITKVRKICQGISFVGPAICMVACGLLTPAAGGAALTGGKTGLIVGLLSLSFALGAWARAGLYCNHQDLSPRFASALLGITNTAGALPGILGVWSAGYLLDVTGSWSTAVFYPIAATQIFGLVIYTIFGSSKRQAWS